MARPNRLLEVEQEHKTPLEKLIPALVNALGSQKAAAETLGVSQATVSTWLKDNGYTPKVTYIKGETDYAANETPNDSASVPSSL